MRPRTRSRQAGGQQSLTAPSTPVRHLGRESGLTRSKSGEQSKSLPDLAEMAGGGGRAGGRIRRVRSRHNLKEVCTLLYIDLT